MKQFPALPSSLPESQVVSRRVDDTIVKMEMMIFFFIRLGFGVNNGVISQSLCHRVVMYSVRMSRFLLSSSRQNIVMAALLPYFS